MASLSDFISSVLQALSKILYIKCASKVSCPISENILNIDTAKEPVKGKSKAQQR